MKLPAEAKRLPVWCDESFEEKPDCDHFVAPLLAYSEALGDEGIMHDGTSV